MKPTSYDEYELLNILNAHICTFQTREHCIEGAYLESHVITDDVTVHIAIDGTPLFTTIEGTHESDVIKPINVNWTLVSVCVAMIDNEPQYECVYELSDWTFTK